MLHQRLISALGILAITVIGVLAGSWILTLLLTLIGWGALRELHRALAAYGLAPFRSLARVLLLALMLTIWQFPNTALLLLGLSLTVMLPIIASFREDTVHAIQRATVTTMCTLYLALPLGAALALRATSDGNIAPWIYRIAGWIGDATSAPGLAWLTWAIAVTWLTDVGAYVGGSVLGGPKLAPRISPGKTWAGAVSGTVCGSLTGWIVAAVTALPLAWPMAFASSMVLSVIGQLGDLAESLLKRALGVKDMGTILPGHGGILDRIDALLFTFPVALAIAWWATGR